MLAGPPAACFLKLGLPEKALEDADRAVQREPHNSKTHITRGAALGGMCMRGDDRFDEARAAYRRALELDPSNEDAKLGLKELERIERTAARRHAQPRREGTIPEKSSPPLLLLMAPTAAAATALGASPTATAPPSASASASAVCCSPILLA